MMTQEDFFDFVGRHVLAEGALIIVAALLAFVFWIKALHMLKRRAQTTGNPWDDIFLAAVGMPVTLLIVLFGMQQLGSLLAGVFPEYETGKMFAVIRPMLVIVTVFWVLLRLISGAERVYRRKKITVGDQKIDPGTVYSVFRIVRGILFIVAILTAMNSLGISISGILAFGGFSGMIIGFAAKDTLSNFFSGMLIFWERPFVIGDWIRSPEANIEGVVEHIGWRMTQVRSFDQRPLYVPNSLFFNGVIENPQRMTNRRIYEYMGLRYDDIDKLPAVLEDVRKMLREHTDIEQTKIQIVSFDRYGASSLDFFVYAMTKTTDWVAFHTVKEDILLKIAVIVSRHDCEFAFPTRTLHHIGAPQVGEPQVGAPPELGA